MSKFEPGQFITLFADASFCPETKAAGFGGWAKYGDPAETFRTGGEMNDCETSNQAEFKALRNTLDALMKLESVQFEGKILVIQSDCQGAIDKLKTTLSLDSLQKCLGLTRISYKWVKGHQGYKSSRSAVNTYCDKTAKHHMRNLRLKLSGELLA